MCTDIRRRHFFPLLGAIVATPAFALGETKAPGFEVKTLIGRKLTLNDYKGKTLVLVFWATWCPHCRRYMAAMQTLYERYVSRKVEILALSVDAGGWKDVGPYVRDNELTLTIALATPAAQRAYDASRGVPLTAVIDPDGNKIGDFLGAPNAQQLRQLLERYAEKA